MSYFEITKCIGESQREQLVIQQEEQNLDSEQVEIIENEVINEFKNNIISKNTNSTNKTNYFVIAAIGFVLLLGGVYGVYQWIERREKEQTETALNEKARQDSLFIANIKWQNLEPFEDKNKWGFCDKIIKRIIVPAQYDTLWNFRDSLAHVKKDNLVGLIDKTGKVVIPLKYDVFEFFYENLARVKKDKLWGFIDKTGKEVIVPQYADAWSFSNGLARIKKGSLWGFIDKTGKEVITPKYTAVSVVLCIE
jgi:hypothetical protein